FFANRRLGRVRVRNIVEPVDLHEIFDPGRVGWEELKGLYEEALSEFEASNFSQASSILGDLLVAFPGDGPALLLMSRVVGAMMAEGEAATFDPVWNLPGQ
ncbi:MAG: hypothetical protein KDM64_07915, partial [Verrucomicrobiae bacterium]|nr:hypothetical protein [Verrucomicrobiae bacterium]